MWKKLNENENEARQRQKKPVKCTQKAATATAVDSSRAAGMGSGKRGTENGSRGTRLAFSKSGTEYTSKRRLHASMAWLLLLLVVHYATRTV